MKKHFCPYCMAPVKDGEPCEACGLTSGTYSPSPHHLPPGTILVERYLVGRVLGEGGFGITYIGCDLRLELKVAIKEYFPSDKVTRHAQASLEVSNYTGALAGNYERGKEKYLQEARTMARMNKQAEIVSVRDFFESNNTAYIVMEYVEGTTFKELVAQKGGRIPAGEFLHMIEPLFSALNVMHETGLIHRDISPDNLMLENGSVRLLDFGCARESTHGTETMTIALKHGYAPIEQYQHKGQGPWTDVYGLCATIYYCLTGKVPQQSLDRLCEDELILPRKLGVDLTENQERALLYGMGIRPRRRYQSIPELYAALYTGVPAPKIETGQSLMYAPGIGQPSAERQQDDQEAAVEERKSGAAEAAGMLKAEAVSGENQDGTAETADMPKTGAVSVEQETGGELEKVRDVTGDAEEGQKSAEEEKRRKTVHQVKIGAAAAAILCLAASPFFLQEKLRPTPTDTVAEPAQPAEGEVQEDPFADAVSVTTASETALRAALSGDAEAVIWDGEGSIQLTGEELVLTKPLYIGKDAHIEIATQVMVESGGRIQIAGELQNRGFFRVKGEGLVQVEDGGRMTGQGSILVEKEENLAVDNGGKAELNGQDFAETGFDRLNYVVFSEEEIFADAVHVRTGQQLLDALSYDNVNAVVIDEDITLEESFRYMDKSVMVNEGVTVTAPFEEEASVCFDGWYFVNYGTISGCFQVGDWNEDGRASNVINYGQITNDMFVESDCNIMNLGEMTLGTGWMETGRFYNIGELIHDNSREDETWLDFLNVQFINLGTFRTEGDTSKDRPVEIIFANGTDVCNHGVIEVSAVGILNNSALISGYGQIFATDGTSDRVAEVKNYGIIRLEYAPSSGKAAAFQMSGETQFDNEGLISRSSHSSFSIPKEFDEYGGVFMPFAWGDDAGDFCYVSTAEELKEALKDEACSMVVVCGDGDITLEEELVVTKGLAVAWPCNLCFTDGGLTLTGGQAYLYDGKLAMNGNAITVSDGAVLYIDSMKECGDLYAENGGQIILRNFEEEAFLPDTSVILRDGGRILGAGCNRLENRTVTIGSGSIFRVINEYDMTGCSIEIEEWGELLIDTPGGLIDENSVLINNGKTSLGVWKEMKLAGEIINNNSMECYGQWNLTGSFINNGNFHVDLGGESFSGDGTIENNGTIRSLSEGLLQEFEGTYSGNEVEYEN